MDAAAAAAKDRAVVLDGHEGESVEASGAEVDGLLAVAGEGGVEHAHGIGLEEGEVGEGEFLCTASSP